MKSILLSLSVAISVLIFISTTNAQNPEQGNWCYTDEHQKHLIEQDPSLIQQHQELEDYILNFKKNYNASDKKAATIIIPVVIHNITHDGGIAYVSKATIDAQIQAMNDDFQRLNADAINTRSLFLPYVADLDIEFRLAHLDPNGECTEGIVRKESPYSYNTSKSAAENVKGVSYWDSKKYLNIWVIDEIEDNGDGTYIAGYAQFPGNGINSTYGIVIVDQNFGGGSRTLTHEVGHCFNLYHTFQSGCSSNCDGGGDRCCDTPPVFESSFNCDNNRNTCSTDAVDVLSPYSSDVVDQYENYMSYSNCQNMFSLDQKTRMLATLNNTSTSTGLAQLSTSGNLAFTGTADPYTTPICKPIADFSYNKEYICEGGNVTFTDESYNATPTGWAWTFTGGSPGASGASSPTITYNNAGTYGVTYSSSTSAGSSAPITKNNIITVSSLTADYPGPITYESFENTTTFNNEWIIENPEGLAWESTTAAATTGSRSVRIRNYFTSEVGEEDALISPSYDLSTAVSKTMRFKVAFAKKVSTDTDRMIVYYSTNCGESWSLKSVLSNANLTTVANQTSNFTPTLSSHWDEKVVDLSSIGTATNVRFKFLFKSGGGNNIYLDDINVGGFSVGIDEFNNVGAFNIYPNPAHSNAKISFSLFKNVENLSVNVKNALGQNVTSIINGQAFTSGQYTLSIDEQRKLPAGIYFIEFNADEVSRVQKLIIQ
ncbi:MAG: T9SS type A sorting domain-containing protein [Vicingus serpentipes]|nr:T9SS type A sorting domain-containing protein [Vicingus serpentipes]